MVENWEFLGLEPLYQGKEAKLCVVCPDHLKEEASTFVANLCSFYEVSNLGVLEPEAFCYFHKDAWTSREMWKQVGDKPTDLTLVVQPHKAKVERNCLDLSQSVYQVVPEHECQWIRKKATQDLARGIFAKLNGGKSMYLEI